MSEETEVIEEENPGDQDNPKTEEKKPAAPAKKPTGNDDRNLLLEKIENLQGDLRKERGTIKTLRTEKEALTIQVKGFELKDKKSGALNKAISEIGEDFEITAEKSIELHDLVNELQDSEELDTKITKLVSIVKTPKNKGTRITTPTLPVTQQQTQKKVDAASLLELAKTDPEAFKAAVRERR